jgi:hypothetical protein
MIEYSTNNQSNWTTLTSSTPNDGTEPWTIPNAPSTTCWVRVSESDGSPWDTSEGPFSIVAVPTISGISPPKASAGTDTEVTISGSNFGSTQGTGKVEFFYATGYAKKEAVIVSWSSTQIRCTVPRDASSGPVTVTTAAGTSNEYTFRVSFGYSGVYWPGAHPIVTFRVNENAPDCTGEAAAVTAAANAWNDAGTNFTYTYGGATTATTASQNGINEIFWGTVSTGALASFNRWYVATNQLGEVDIVLNGTFPWSASAEAGHHDIQNVLTALLGYNLGLTLLFGDVGGGDDTDKTMYYWANLGETYKRTLHPDDIAGIRWIYRVRGGRKVDFNGDGQEDILWRYHGSGAYQGLNVIWLMNQTGSPSPVALKGDQAAAQGTSLLAGTTASVIYQAPQGTGSHPIPVPERVFKTILNGGEAPVLKPKQVMRTPMDHDRALSASDRGQGTNNNVLGLPARKDAMDVVKLGSGTGEIASISLATEVVFSQLLDTNWWINGTGDFNGDGHTDILWRYYGTGPYQGLNDIWFMNGTTFVSEDVFSQVADTNWRINTTGDFNGDGHTDILWRYYGTGPYQGLNDIWFMNGSTFIGEAVFSQVLDTAWQIAGTGDFNSDGQTDILWRNYGTGPYQGLNVIWFMNGSTFQGEAVFSQVTDTAWVIDGMGDFNNDGQTDILWRYYGTGAYQGLNDIWYMNGTTFVSEEVFSQVMDTNWRIMNH